MKEKNSAAVALGKRSQEVVKKKLGIRRYKAEMSRRAKNGLAKRYSSKRSLSTVAAIAST